MKIYSMNVLNLSFQNFESLLTTKELSVEIIKHFLKKNISRLVNFEIPLGVFEVIDIDKTSKD